MPSLRKLAELSGVSPSTVTRALRNDTRIGAATRTRIQQLAEQYHYLPNRLMQSLVSGRSQAIGVLAPSIITPYSVRLLSGILQQATQSGYQILIKESHGELTTSLAAIQTFIEQRVDGILLDTGHLEPIPRKTILEMRSHHVIPIGLDATTFMGEVDRVHTDEQALTLAAIDYLLHLGHTRIAFFGRTVGGQWLGRGAYMQQAFKLRLLSTRYFIDVKEPPPYTNVPLGDMLAQLRQQPVPPTAIIAWEDPLAALILKEATRLGLQVPGQLSVLGFGNLLFSELLTPTLTSFEQHPETVGAEACRLLLQRIQNQQDPLSSVPTAIAIKPTLIPRESCTRCPRR